jgi:hypothetical protein
MAVFDDDGGWFGGAVEGVWMFPIRYVGEAIDDQLRLCRNKLHKIRDPTLRSATLEAVKNLQHR